MALDLRCDCGYQVQLQGDEARELTWCPRCRKVLLRPREYTAAQRQFTRGGGSSSSTSPGTNGTAAGRIAAFLVLGVLIAAGRASCSPRQYEPPPRIEIPDIRMPPMQFERGDGWPGPVDPLGRPRELPEPPERLPEPDDP